MGEGTNSRSWSVLDSTNQHVFPHSQRTNSPNSSPLQCFMSCFFTFITMPYHVLIYFRHVFSLILFFFSSFSLILKIYFHGSLSSYAIYNDSLYWKVLFPSFSFLSIPVKLCIFHFPAPFSSKYFSVGINSHAFYPSPTIYLSIDR